MSKKNQKAGAAGPAEFQRVTNNRACDLVFGPLRFEPGSNKVSTEELANACARRDDGTCLASTLRRWERSKFVKVEDWSDEPVQVQAPVLEIEPSAPPATFDPKGFEPLSVNESEALGQVKACVNPAQLDAWFKDEKRDAVSNAVLERLKELDR